MRRLAALMAVVSMGLIASLPLEADTITSACRTSTGTLYNVVPDGAKAKDCRGSDQKIRLLEVVDTSTYYNVRSTTGGEEKLLAELGAAPKVQFWLSWDTEEDFCQITADFPEPESTYNLQTGKTLEQDRQPFSTSNSAIVVRLHYIDNPARGEFPERAFLREETNEIFIFSNAYLRYDGECFGAVTIQRDLDRKMFAK